MHRCMEPLEKSELQVFVIGQAKSTSYFIQLTPTSDFDLIQSMKANLLIMISKTVGSIVTAISYFMEGSPTPILRTVSYGDSPVVT